MTYYRDNEIPQRGQRVSIPVHYDLWMRGATTGTVRSFHAGEPGQSAYVKVKLDHAGVKRQLKVWRLDWTYMNKL